VGGSKPVPVNIRLLATSNRNMQEEIKQGRFREDLYFRLNVVNIEIPPLGKRPKDILVLAQYFMKKYVAVNGTCAKKISPEALDVLAAYGWPGNVRELENTLHRAVLLSPHDLILPEHLGLKTQETHAALSSCASQTPLPQVGQTLAEAERQFIFSTLDHCVGDDTQAAHLLGLSLRALRAKLKEYGKAHGLLKDPPPTPHALRSL
jgi:DNA-binding NtrC family response regulator